MAIEVFEKFKSREGESGADPSSIRLYDVFGSDDDPSIRIALETASPSLIDVYGNGTQIIWRQNVSIRQVSNGHWEGSVTYGRTQPTNNNVYAFDTTGGTEHVTQSLQTMQQVVAPDLWSVAPDFKGAIGVTPDGVEGVDIVVPVFKFTRTHYLPASWVTAAYQNTIYKLTGAVNDKNYLGYKSGELRFDGATGSIRVGGDWEIQFKFAASPNKTDLTVGDITGINKEGWDKLWIRYVDQVDDTAKALVKRPAIAVVDRVYPRADFDDLGLE